jgi:ring-1,2-phenylacetyl-CoA epoxidase subunit PaaD
MNDAAAWDVLRGVLDPEVPVLSVVELGIVRDVRTEGGTAHVTVTPTYSGCPATEVIRDSIAAALRDAGWADVQIDMQLAPAWTTDWIGPDAAEKLRAYGIAPPHLKADEAAPLRFHPRDIPCPRCGSRHTERLSPFGATACKALHRCLDCREPFEHFKPH